MKITDVLDRYSIPYKRHGEHHHVTGNYVGFDCPFCSPGSRRFRMGYHLTKGFTFCWTCGHHPMIKTMMALTGESLEGTLAMAGKIHRERAPRDNRRGNLSLPYGVGELQERHRKYLEKDRGLNPDVIQTVWNVQGIGVAPRFAWSLFIPIYDSTGRMVSWTTRSTGNKKARYGNAKPDQEIVSHKKVLYGENLARHSICITEGPIDAWAIGPGAVSTMGVRFSRSQLLRMSRYCCRVVLFDREPEAQKTARELCNSLKCFPGDTFRIEVSGKDPASSPPEELQEIREKFLS